jgi:PAS domain S-box-containing protein
MKDTATVLLVDDEPGVADTTAAFVERANDSLTTTTTTSADTALDRFEAGDIDCIVSDYNMPGMDGLALYEAVTERRPGVPFILFTGKGSEEVASEALSLGVTDYLQKETGTEQYAVLTNRIENAIEARRAEQRLERSEERYQHLIESSPAGVVITSLDDSIIYANGAAASFIGADEPEALHGMATLDLIHPEDEATFRERWEGFREHESQEATEQRFIGFDGETRHAIVASTPVTYEGESAIQTVLTDVTEQRRAEQELREERAFTERALDTIDDVFYALDEKGEFVRWNEQVTAVTGYTDEEIATMSPSQLFVEGDRDRIRAAITTVIEDGHVSVEATLVTKDGERRLYEFTGSRLTDDEGEAVGLCGIGRDITERRERERDLEHERERVATLFENIPDPTVRADVQGGENTIKSVNEAFEDTFGYAEETMVGRSLNEFIVPPERVEEAERLDHALENGERITRELRRQTADGDRRDFLFRTAMVDDGSSEGFGIYTDISQRKQRERDLERYETAVEAAPVGVFVLDPEGAIVWANDRAAATVAHTVGELDGEPFVSLFEEGIVAESAADDYDAVLRDLLSAESDRTTGRYDVRVTHPEDGERTIRVHVSPLPYDETFRGTVLVAEDVTERKQREEQLEAQATAMDASMDGMAIMNDEEYTYVNEAHAAIYGYDDPETLLGLSWRDLYDPPERERIESAALSALEETGSWRGEMVGRRADGTTFPQDLSLTVLDDGSIVCVVRDITPQKRRERVLTDLHDWTRKMMDATEPAAVASLAVETAERVLDLSMCALWLYDDETGTLRPTAATDDSDAMVGELPTYESGNSLSWEAFAAGEARTYEDVSGADGHNSATPVRSEMILPLGEYGVMNVGSTTADEFDETDEALARLLATNVETALERAERERERAANRRLLERQNERLEEFAGVVSHDLRNPLTVARGRLELLAEKIDSQHVQPIADALERMDGLIEECLIFARQGQLVTHPTRVDIEEVAERAWRTVDTGDTDLTVEDLDGVAADDERLRTLFENLFRNAIEHGDATTVRVGPLDDAPGMYIADDGPGIAESEREAVFNRGYSTSETGTGLGLAIVDTLTEAHGWEMRIADAAGARFEILFEPAAPLPTPRADE